jgi:peptidoglycan/LPS O-acetylase OafA/YrhL
MGGRDTGYLNGLRALSALWVLFAHCMLWGGYSGAVPSPKIAVAVFMVMSGYLMALTASDFSRLREWSRFYLRRFFRLAPLYYLVLTVVALSPWMRDGLNAWQRFEPGSFYSPDRADFSLGNLTLHYSFVFGMIPNASTSTLLPDWSLSLEMQFYAAFPAIWYAICKWGPLRVGAFLSMVSLAVIVWLRPDAHEPSILYLQLPYFLAGILVFIARKDPALLVGAVLLSVFEAPMFGAWTLAIPGAVALIFALDRWSLRRLRGLLDNRISAFGADVSYGVYLLHIPFIALGGLMRLPLLTLVLFVLVGSVGVSYALHWTVERPGVAIG